MGDEEHGPLVDLGGYPEISAAGIGDLYSVPGGRARFILFDWYKIDGVWQRRIVGTVTRGLDALATEIARVTAAHGRPMLGH